MKKFIILAVFGFFVALGAMAQPNGGGDPGHGMPCGGAAWGISGPTGNWDNHATYTVTAVGDAGNPCSNIVQLTVYNDFTGTPGRDVVVERIDGTPVGATIHAGQSYAFTVNAQSHSTCDGGDGSNTVSCTLRLGTTSWAIPTRVAITSVSGYNVIGSPSTLTFTTLHN